MEKAGLFIAATGQNIGKTTICLGLVSGLLKRIQNIGFIKPVGQEHVTFENVKVDKDVVLFKDHFDLKSDISCMSPVIFDKHFTRKFLDYQIPEATLLEKIKKSYGLLQEESDYVVVEGTGHVGVGSIANLNNAIVCKELGLDCVLIAEGGLGSSFDKLTLNKDLMEKHEIKIKGIILNKVLPEKKEMVTHYMEKALARWNIPLIGVVPYNKLLSTPSMHDFAQLFNTHLLSGKEQVFAHFKKFILVACSDIRFDQLIEEDQLIITPASREDIILTTLSHYWDQKVGNAPFKVGMILTGTVEPSKSITDQLKKAHIPALYIPEASYPVMKKITRHIAKIQKEDTEKIEEAKIAIEGHIDFEKILN
jgi:phosphate acetyltransferase